MKELELYDIITLDDGSEYTILEMMIENNQRYYFIAPIDNEENPDIEKIKVVKETKTNGLIMIEEENNDEIVKKLSNIFLEKLQSEE